MNILQVNSEEHSVVSGLAVAGGNAHIDAYNSSTVILFDSARCKAWHEADVTARGDNFVRIYGSAQADVGGTSDLQAFGHSHFTARARTTVRAGEQSTGFVLEHASLLACDSARVTMMSDGELRVCDSATVVYAPPARGICCTVTAHLMQQLASGLSKARGASLVLSYDEATTACLDQLRRALFDGQASKAWQLIINNEEGLGRYQHLVEVLRRHEFWRKS
ncbi:MAG: hypothetical protein JSS83_15630 [Cyanobacteria bacterium SZAS LIN-3]|nr:hypothetical protein [Cyanobacteria bacterium SZAS LIN-3]